MLLPKGAEIDLSQGTARTRENYRSAAQIRSSTLPPGGESALVRVRLRDRPGHPRRVLLGYAVLLAACVAPTTSAPDVASPPPAAQVVSSPASSSAAAIPTESPTPGPAHEPAASPVASLPPVATSSPAPASSPAVTAAPATAAPPIPPSAAPTPSATISVSPGTTNSPSPDAVPGRSLSDRPDELAGAQIHYVYAIPADGRDERLDVNGAIANSIASIQSWLRAQTSGRQLRVDTFQGRPDITFYRLSQSDAQILASGPYVRDRIEQELKTAGLIVAGKLYAVFYGGGSTYACGGGAWPPALPGLVAAQYLKGTPPGAIACATNPVGASASQPGYEDFAMLHELLHTMGIVASCAPHFTQAGHVSDDPRDLMYAGPQPWQPSILDVGHDDYFSHANAGCADLGRLPWLS